MAPQRSGLATVIDGEAVAAGIICASRLAERRGLIPCELTERQERLLSRFGLPTAAENWPVEELLAAMRHDKKNRGGRLRFVLPRRLGEVALMDDVVEDEIRSALKR